MIPFCNDTITIYHYDGRDRWLRQVVRGVKWQGGTVHRSVRTGQNALEPAGDICIPLAAGKNLKMDAGGKDYVVYGSGAEIGESYTPEDLKRDHPELATIARIEDHSKAPFLQHWKVTLA